MVLYYNTVRQNEKNAKYPHRKEINCIKDLEQVVQYDHVSASYKDNYRKNDNFISADCSMFDVDNTGKNKTGQWITPDAVQEAFPDVRFYVSYSRNHMKQKGDDSPRPKFHVYFPDITYSTMEEYKQLKAKVCRHFPHFDSQAKDAARCFFGVEESQVHVEYYPGSQLLSEFLETVVVPVASENKGGSKHTVNQTGIIPEGERNNTLFKIAMKIRRTIGDGEIAFQKLLQENEKCSPPLEQKEVEGIWKSALKYSISYKRSDRGYRAHNSFKPQEFTDVGQAKVFKEKACKSVRYSPATDYLFFNGKLWKEDFLKVHKMAQKLTDNQLKEACLLLQEAQRNENKAVINGDKEREKSAKEAIKRATQYRRHALTYQHTLRISATLKEAQPMLAIDLEKLDADGFLLNTPTGTVDLRTKELKPHNPADFCTKITSKGPSGEGKELFDNFLNVITCGDTSLAEYLQYVAGMIAVGKVFCENLIIAYGCGCNGKSTFFNLISRVLGDYSGSLSSEVLTANCRKNKSPEYAELRGKRLAIAAELEDGMQLDTSVVKKLCSTDPICAEKKYKDPFRFIPTHTMVLYTNHLPNVWALDSGTWRRLIVVPFNAVICSNQDIKNYADYLFENAGGSVMSWIIEGAYKFIDAKYDIRQPEAVQEAIKTYREENDWLSNYITERCEVAKAFTQPSGELYQDYREYSKNMGEPPRSNASFNKALAEKGFKKQKNGRGSFIYGLRLRGEVPACEFPIISASQMMDSDGENQESDDSEIQF